MWVTWFEKVPIMEIEKETNFRVGWNEHIKHTHCDDFTCLDFPLGISFFLRVYKPFFHWQRKKMLFISWLTVVLMFVLMELDQRYQPQNRNMTVRIMQRNKFYSLFGSEGFEGFYTENDFKREKKDCRVSFLPRLMTQFSVFHFKKWDHFLLSMIRKTVFARFSISNTVK